MADKIDGVDPNKSNPNNPKQENQAPPDPSNTSSIGQKVEQGVAGIKEGLSEQSNEWEDKQERGIPVHTETNKAESYIKKPSPEEMNTEDQQA